MVFGITTSLSLHCHFICIGIFGVLAYLISVTVLQSRTALYSGIQSAMIINEKGAVTKDPSIFSSLCKYDL